MLLTLEHVYKRTHKSRPINTYIDWARIVCFVFFKQHSLYFFSLCTVLGAVVQYQTVCPSLVSAGPRGTSAPTNKEGKKEKKRKACVPIFIVLNTLVQISVLLLWIISHTHTAAFRQSDAHCVDVEALHTCTRRTFAQDNASEFTLL